MWPNTLVIRWGEVDIHTLRLFPCYYKSSPTSIHQDPRLQSFIWKRFKRTFHGFVRKLKLILPKYQTSSVSFSAIVIWRTLLGMKQTINSGFHSCNTASCSSWHRTQDSVRAAGLPGVNNSITSASVENLLCTDKKYWNTQAPAKPFMTMEHFWLLVEGVKWKVSTFS